MTGNNLISEKQINTLLPALRNCELFSTIQSFDKDANTLYTPIYADLDGPTAVDDCIDIVSTIENFFGITPNIYFSGSKGFHIVIPFKIMHTIPHEIVKRFFAMLGYWESLDHAVYTGRRLFRMAGSIHYKTGRYKTKIRKEELEFLRDEIVDVCDKQDFTDNCEWIEHKDLSNAIEKIKGELSREMHRQDQREHKHQDYNVEFTPCMKKIITTRPNDGEWNRSIVTIARFFNRAKVEKNTAINILEKFPHWKVEANHRGHDIESIFRSIYRRDSFFSCRGNELLERYCDIFCMFNSEDIWPYRDVETS